MLLGCQNQADSHKSQTPALDQVSQGDLEAYNFF